MGFGIERRAHGKTGWFRRTPEVREVGDRLGRLLNRMERAAVLRSGWKKQGRFVAELELHPAAPAATVSVELDATLVVRAETSRIGPGYHADVVARLTPILDELDYTWDEPVEDPAHVQDAMCAWLAGELRGGATRIGLPSGRSFHVDAPVLTALGPRDAAWRDAVLAEPRRGADAFAWWQPGAAHGARSRALLAMWLEMPCREPLDKAELALMTRIDADLRAARRGPDRELELPWPEWAQILEWLGIDDERAAEVRARAGGKPSTIGYRRYDLDVELSGGWTVRLPGAFVGSWEDDGERYWATDGPRSVEFTSLTADDEGDSDRLLAVAPERHPVIERLVEGDRRGRAEAHEVDDVRVVYGLMACAPHVGLVTCKGPAGDDAWALATWRSLRHAGG